MNSSVWCDDVIHCPSGDDETFLKCSPIMKLPAEILFTLSLMILLFSCIFAIFAYRWRNISNFEMIWILRKENLNNCFLFFRKIKRKLQGSSVLQVRLKSLSSMDTAVLDEKEVICWQSDNSVRYVEVDRVTTVWPDFDHQDNIIRLDTNYSKQCTGFFQQMAHLINVLNV